MTYGKIHYGKAEQASRKAYANHIFGNLEKLGLMLPGAALA